MVNINNRVCKTKTPKTSTACGLDINQTRQSTARTHHTHAHTRGKSAVYPWQRPCTHASLDRDRLGQVSWTVHLKSTTHAISQSRTQSPAQTPRAQTLDSSAKCITLNTRLVSVAKSSSFESSTRRTPMFRPKRNTSNLNESTNENEPLKPTTSCALVTCNEEIASHAARFASQMHGCARTDSQQSTK